MTESTGTFKPLKPRPRVFALLCGVFAVWIVALLILYFKTVYPLRHPGTATTPVALPTADHP